MGIYQNVTMLCLLVIAAWTGSGQEDLYCYSCEYQVDGGDDSDGIDCVNDPDAVNRDVYCPGAFECYSRSVLLKGRCLQNDS